jgi:signal transduction histidine kinase/ligand-binding sensor domain-containing protein
VVISAATARHFWPESKDPAGAIFSVKPKYLCHARRASAILPGAHPACPAGSGASQGRNGEEKRPMLLANRKSCLTLTALCCLAILPICAPAQYRFDHWTADNGLPQNSVRDIVQTRDGYLWLSTFDGLVRFDGVRFTVFNKSNSPGIASNRFILLFEDRFGDLWASLEAGGLVRLHRDGFTTYTLGHGLPIENVGLISDDGQGNLLISHGFQLFRWENGKFQPANELRLPANQPAAEAANHLQYIYFQRDNSRAIMFMDGQLRGLNGAELPPAIDVIQAVGDRRGNNWLTTSKYLIHLKGVQAPQIHTQNKGVPGTKLKFVLGNRPSPQAISQNDAGIWLTDLYSMQSTLMTSQLPEGFDPFVIYGDREGNYWFGSLYDGLYRARKSSLTAYSKPQGLNAREVYPICEDREGAVWMGSTGNGLYRYKDGVFTNFNGADSFGGTVSALYVDRAGRLWVNGRWRFENGGFARVMNQETLSDSLGTIWTICEDSDGAFWFGAEHGVVREHHGVVTRFTTKHGLAGDDTKVIIADAMGGVWIGSYGGLTHFKDGRFKVWTEKDGLPGNTVRALSRDAEGVLWIGTYDSGLGRFKDGRFTRYTQRDGLYDNGVFQILEDEQGWCWMSCNRGVYRVRKQELNDFADGKIKTITSIGYGKSDGMLNVECNGGRWPAGIKAQDGKLWFPTMGGVVVVDPATLATNAQAPPVVIEGMKIDNQAVSSERWVSAMTNPQSDVIIEPGQENFEIEYTALSFINSENLRFRYKLEGLDHAWVEAGTRRTAYFSYVPPGQYTFKVIAANSDGVWNMEGQSLRITVFPPFYRTWWFMTLAALSMAGAVLAVFKYRVAQLKQAQAAQQAFARQLIESQEAERKRIASELHDSLGQSLILIRNWSLMGASQLEAQSSAREEFDEITATASRAINEVRTIAYNLGPYYLDRLGLAETIRDMINRVAQASGVAFTTDLETLDSSLSREAEINLYRIAQEAINNLVKHSGATEATVALKQTAAGVKLIVSDNGHGFDAAATLSGARQRGFGLHGLEERVRLLRGAWSLHSAPGSGTRLEVTLPFVEKTV